MSQYTLEIRELIENDVEIFDFEYPLFDPLYKEGLEKKIIDHYFFREIGCETAGRFIFNLRVKMNEIMPIYNKMYEVLNLTQRVLDNYDVTETYTSADTHLFSDTPQGRIAITDSTGGASTGFVTDITEDKNSWTRTMVGNIGIQTDANAVTQYIEALKNVDMMIINDLNILFMGVY